MARHLALTVILILVSGAWSPLRTQPSPEDAPVKSTSEARFFLSPTVQANFGETEYVMDIQANTDSGLAAIKSQLEFPLDVVMMGARGGLILNEGTKRAWRFELGAYTNVVNPGNKMVDRDWTVFRAKRLDLFSYTESDAEMTSWLLTANVFKTVAVGDRGALDLMAGFWYQRIEQDIIGITGWQIDTQTLDSVSGSIPDIDALYYLVTYKLPHLGLRGVWRPAPSVELDTRAAFTAVFVSDVDDHLLRYKESTSSITGSGLLAGFELRYRLRPPHGNIYMALTGDLMYLSASGSQTQEWYDDETRFDPSTGEEVIAVPKGTVIHGLPHDITSTQARIGLTVGYRFR